MGVPTPMTKLGKLKFSKKNLAITYNPDRVIFEVHGGTIKLLLGGSRAVPAQKGVGFLRGQVLKLKKSF